MKWDLDPFPSFKQFPFASHMQHFGWPLTQTDTWHCSWCEQNLFNVLRTMHVFVNSATELFNVSFDTIETIVSDIYSKYTSNNLHSLVPHIVWLVLILLIKRVFRYFKIYINLIALKYIQQFSKFNINRMIMSYKISHVTWYKCTFSITMTTCTRKKTTA